jgi:aminopeptidase N
MGRDGRSRRLTTASLALVVWASAVPVAAKPILFPPTPNGPAQWRDERDVAPFEAAWKAEGLRRARRMAVSATPNQLAYDVTWYDLDLTFNPSGFTVGGTVRMQATVVSGPLATIDLDLQANMSVSAASSAAIPATFSRAGDLLTVNLDRSYATGEKVDVRVTYLGSPISGSFGYTIANGRQLIWSLSEPYGAHTWWPCKDLPADKADSVTIRYTVPTGLTTASNGTQLSATDNGVQAVTRWRESHPIATYLVSIASYPYTHTVDWYRPAPGDSMRIDFFNYPETASGVAAVQAKVKTMIAAYAARFGPYPFQDEKYGHAQFQFSGGMEHQTCTSLGAFAEFVVAHELGHQWWGDLVTCRDFHHVWLNEGFATYMEAIWAESQGGPAAYHADLAFNKYYGPGTVFVPDDQNEARIFDSNLSYDKGSWVLHMLRHVLGDATFFAAMLQYRATNAYGTATTETFRAACEAASGRDLTQYFQQWVYGERYPVYRATWTSQPAGGGYDVALTLEQRQTWQLFTMPVDVRITTTAGTQDFTVPDSLASQSFTLHVDAQPTALELDADDWILKQVEQPVVQPPFDRGVLVVNGVDWATYGAEITSAYTDRAFSGSYLIDFWDHFSAPSGGYPVVLPAPLGHGPVPPEVLGHYRNVVWVGNAVNGDVDSWVQTPIRPYLDAGGNVLLLCKDAQVFLDDGLLAYLGLTLTNVGVTLNDCLATRPGFVDLGRTGTQSANAVFDTVRTQPDTQLLYKTTSGFSPQRGVGMVRLRAGGAGLRATGGRFAFLSGRPYRWNHANLSATTTTILSQYFLEPLNGLDVPGAGGAAARLQVSPARPDPAAGPTRLRLELPRAARVRLEVIDVTGRLVRAIDAGEMPAGANDVTWDGRDAGGRPAAAGLYWLRLRAGTDQAFRRVVRLR